MVILDSLASLREISPLFPCNSTLLLILETRSADLNICLATHNLRGIFFFLVTRYMHTCAKMRVYYKDDICWLKAIVLIFFIMLIQQYVIYGFAKYVIYKNLQNSHLFASFLP